MDPVRAQYETFPYPPRDPQDEAKRLLTGSPSRLAEIDHYLFEGARDWSKPFRALIAGGGTGDALIMLAAELTERGVPSEVVYLDLSRASRKIAEARAAVRGLKNIAFRTGSLLEAGDLGRFDYVDCCGVLHHLEDPAAGLAALVGALEPSGGLGLMLYGALGRTGVYDVQSILKLIAPPAMMPPERRVAAARTLLAHLPPTNRFKRNPFLGDHQGSDAGLFDLLLHERDRAYCVPDIRDLLEHAGLTLASFVPAALYDPATFLGQSTLAPRLAALGPWERAAMGELLVGSLKTHVFYAAPAARGNTVAALSADGTPALLDLDAVALARMARAGKPLTGSLEGLKLSLPLGREVADALALIDGRRSFAEIATALSPPMDWLSFRQLFAPAYRALNSLNKLLMTTSRR